MVIAFGTPTDLPEILSAVQTRIADGTGIRPTLVFPSLLGDAEFEKTPPGNTFVVVRPAAFRPVQPIVSGAAHAAFDGRLAVSLWHRLHTDQAVKDANWLTKDPDGVLAKWLFLLGCLHLFAPPPADLDASRCILIEPMRLDSGFEFPQKRPGGWGRLDSAWQVRFVHRVESFVGAVVYSSDPIAYGGEFIGWGA